MSFAIRHGTGFSPRIALGRDVHYPESGIGMVTPDFDGRGLRLVALVDRPKRNRFAVRGPLEGANVFGVVGQPVNMVGPEGQRAAFGNDLVHVHAANPGIGFHERALHHAHRAG